MERPARIAAAAGIVAALLVVAAPAESSRRAAHGSSTRDWAYALAIQRDGKYVTAGLSRQPGGPSFALARYTGKGMLDRSFGRGGKVLTLLGQYGADALAIQRDGKLVVSGSGVLVRYRADGSLDSSFGRGGRITAGRFAIQKDGKIVVNALSGGHSVLARYNARGSLDRSFGRGGQARIDFGGYLAIQKDRKIVAASTNFAGGSFGFRLARYNADGTPDSGFGHGGKVVIAFGADSSSILNAVAIEPDGNIVVAGEADIGETSASEDFALARFTAEGKLDASFGTGGKVTTDFTPKANCDGCTKSRDSAHAVAIQADGKIVAVGSSDAHGNCDDRGNSCDNFALARYNADGSLDPSFGTGGKVVTGFVRRPSHEPSSSWAEAVAIQADDKLVVAGLGAGYDFALGRYTTSGRLDASFGTGGKVLTDFGSG